MFNAKLLQVATWELITAVKPSMMVNPDKITLFNPDEDAMMVVKMDDQDNWLIERFHSQESVGIESFNNIDDAIDYLETL